MHLKSLQDEFEYMESNMPKKNEDPPTGKQATSEAAEGKDSERAQRNFDEEPSYKEDLDYPDHWGIREPVDPSGHSPGPIPGDSQDFDLHMNDASSPQIQNAGVYSAEATGKYKWGPARFSNDFDDRIKGTGADDAKRQWYDSPAEIVDDTTTRDNNDSDAPLNQTLEQKEINEALEKHYEYLKSRKQKLFDPASPVPVEDEHKEHDSKWSNDGID